MGKRSSCLPQGSQKHPIVELEAFISAWNVTHTELAEICESDLTTVEKWFLATDCPNRLQPSPEQKQKLAQAHYLWRLERDCSRADRLRQMYNLRPRTLAPGGMGHG